jgi:hypothetical protein
MSRYPVGKQNPEGKFTFKSKMTDEYVLGHQYIAELIVARKAFTEGISLPYKYWNGSCKWAKEFKSQVAQSAKLCNKYDCRAIINALHDLQWCWSLRNKKLLNSIDGHQKKLDATKKRLEESAPTEVNNNTGFTPKPTVKKQSLLAKLRGN